MSILKKLWALPVLALAMVSCNSDDKGNTITQNFNTGFNYVVDRTTSESFIDDEVSYEMTFDYDKMLANVTISSLQLSESTSGMTVNLTELPWAYTEDGNRQIYVSNVQVGLNTTISNFRLTMVDRNIYMSNQYAYVPIVTINYTVDNRYSVTTFMRSYVYVDNSTSVTTVATGDIYRPKQGTVYGVSIDPKKRKASLLIDGAVFAAAMEAHPVQMTFPNLDITFSSNGYDLKCTETIPEAYEGGKPVPYESFKITNLVGYALLSGNTSLNYRCANRENPCDVNTELDYFIQSVNTEI